VDLRKQEEAEFHNRLRSGILDQRWSHEAEERVKHDPLWANLKYYSIERRSVSYMREWLQRRCPGKIVLDFGCGNGEESLFAAEHGADRVVGVDISRIAVENSRMRASKKGLSDKVEFCVTDGENLNFASNSFDLAMEYGVLHHVDLDITMRHLARVLKQDGQMICTETLGHNPAIRLYRAATPHLRTKWEAEHVLRRKDFRVISKYFDQIESRFFHLSTLAAVPLRRLPWFMEILTALESVDEVLLKVPFLKWHAWQVVFILSRPNKDRVI
jgi:ubiquinone/menaquinone biosynthesis C-methylase UbiE